MDEVVTGVTFQEVDALVEQYNKLEAEKETLAAQVTEKNKEMMKIQGRLAQYLKELGRSEYDSPFGEVETKETWSITLPKDEPSRQLLWAHLKERDLFDSMISINANSLNALFRRDFKKAQDEGDLTFSMPGIAAPKVYETTKIKPKK